MMRDPREIVCGEKGDILLFPPIRHPRERARGKVECPLFPRRRAGFSLLETVLSSLLVGVLLVAAMRSVGASAFAQYRAAEQVTAQFLADGLLAEILAKDYREPGTTVGFGLETGESSSSKANYDDVDDYHNWSESPPQFADGSPMPGLDGWKRKVSVLWVVASDPTQQAFSDTGAKRVTVTVEHNGRTVAARTALRTEAP